MHIEMHRDLESLTGDGFRPIDAINGELPDISEILDIAKERKMNVLVANVIIDGEGDIIPNERGRDKLFYGLNGGSSYEFIGYVTRRGKVFTVDEYKWRWQSACDSGFE